MVTENSPTLVLSIYIIVVVLGIVLLLKFSKNKTRKISSLRFFIQIAAVFVVFMGLLIGPFNVPIFEPLGPSPRDRLVGADFLGDQLPMVYLCRYLPVIIQMGEQSPAPYGNFKPTFFPSGTILEATKLTIPRQG